MPLNLLSQFQKKHPRRHVLDPALSVAPVSPLAQFHTQPRATPIRMLGQQITDQTKIRAAQLPPLHD